MVREHHRGNVRLNPVLAGAVMVTLAALPWTVPAEADGTPRMDRPLTDRPGDPRHGQALALDFNTGDCVICHKMPIPGIQADAFGDIGPSLDGVGSRMSPGELRQRIADPKALSPDTLMPGYFVTDGLNRVDPKYAGKTILSAQDVEDLVAYLSTLK